MLDIYENNLYFLELELKEKYKDIDFQPAKGISINVENELEDEVAATGD